MLLEFRTKNYKSFKEELVFSMLPAPKQKGLDRSLLKKTIGRKEHKALSTAIIYGPNAAGKTNIISAMDTFRSIVMQGHVRNEAQTGNPNVAAEALELIPNSTLQDGEPVSFSISFTTGSLLINYGFEVDLGNFLDAKYPRKIIKETLYLNEKMIFDRGVEEVRFGRSDLFRKEYMNPEGEFEGGPTWRPAVRLNPEELFLRNGFRYMFSFKLDALIYEWFRKDFIIVYRTDQMKFRNRTGEYATRGVYVEKSVNDVVEELGCRLGTVGYVNDGESGETKVYVLLDSPEEKHVVRADVFESFGTTRLINMFPAVSSALKRGSILVVDELDGSLHPIAMMNLIDIFHDETINVNGAQLVFNSHNPVYLNGFLFRRDEIKFVERDPKTRFSRHYSLSDFGTTGENAVRKGEGYMKNYLEGRYGAIKSFDCSPMIRASMKED